MFVGELREEVFQDPLGMHHRRRLLLLPELEEQPGLPEAVLALLIQIEDFKSEQLPALMRIAADGKVSEDEVAAYRAAVAEIMELIRRAYACGYAKE